MKPYVLRVLSMLTQGLNTLLGGNEDQSFSSRSFEARSVGRPWARAAVPLLDLVFGKNHCERSFNSDTERTYLNVNSC
jgi:hypothetical protein